ncbi:MAG: two-component regulator propeller domain-containing protein [Candidatus Kapaibacteriota bacterium]
MNLSACLQWLFVRKYPVMANIANVLCFVAFFGLTFSLLNAQTVPTRPQSQTTIRFEHLTIEQGLSQSSVHCVMQDKRGFIWLGTQDGANKYDGYSFSIYRHRASDTTTLSDNWITDLYEDNDGQIWVMTRNGLNLFNAAEEKFRRFTAMPLVRAIASDSAHHVYIGTVQGLFLFDHSTGSMTQLSANPVYDVVSGGGQILIAAADGAWKLVGETLAPLTTDARFAGKPIWAIAMRKQNAQEQNTQEQNAKPSVALMSSYHMALLDATSGKVLSSLPLRGFVNPQQNSFSIIPNADGSLWLHLPPAVILWHPERNISLPFESSVVRKSDIPAVVNAVARASDNALWVATSQGIWIIPPHNFSDESPQKPPVPLVLEPNPTEVDALNNSEVLSLYQDRLGTMWVGTRTGGANLWNPRRYKFTIVRHNPFNVNSLGAGGVRSFLSAPNGGFWVGTDKGLSYYDAAKQRWMRFEPRLQDQTSLSPSFIIKLLYDDTGKLWIGTRGGGLNRLENFNPNTGKAVFKRFLSNLLDTTALASNSVWSMCLARKSATKGYIWIATQGGGLHLLNPLTEKMQRFRHNAQNPSSLTTDSIRAVFEDSKGRLWLATSGYGLIQFSAEKGVIASYRSNADSTSLSNNTVTGIFEDKKGGLWITTAAGLNRYCEATPQQSAHFERFTANNGLPNEFVYGVLEDDAGNIWMSTNNGLACLNPQTRTVRAFDVHDGLQSNEFNTGAFYQSADGTMYFGGVAGYNSFKPATVLAYKTITPPVVLISFKVHDETRAFTHPLAEMRDITLDFHENVISFEFVALDFTGASRQIRYNYMLENFDTYWLQAGNRRYAAYTNLDPGEYRFRVRAGADPAAVNNGEGASILIRIRPPFWATWWFRLLMLGALIGALWLGVQWRLRGIRRQNEILEEQVEHRTEQLTKASEEIQRQNVQLHDQNIALEMAIDELAQLNKEKNEFLGIAAHDLKNPLTGIMLSVQLMQRYRAKMSESEVVETLQKVYQAAERMFAIITNLLDINAIESGRFNFTIATIPFHQIARAVAEDYRARAAAKNITIIVEQMSLEDSSFHALADRAAATEILENLISNAVKYSPPEKRVWVRALAGKTNPMAEELLAHGIPLTRELPTRSVIIAVQDEGQGLSDKDKEQLFGRFAKLSARPTGGEHSTGLGLSIVKKMVEAMDGDVWCESVFGNGATFLIALPMAEEK